MKHYLLLVFISIFLFSCQQELYLEHTDFTPKLVVNSLFTTTSTDNPEIEVYVHSSRNVLDSESSIKEISAASVVIKDSQQNILATLDYTDEGRYATDQLVLVAGESYTLEVISEGFETVTATSMIPTLVDASIQNTNLISDQTSESLDVDLRLRDNDQADNYYVYEVGDSQSLKFAKEEPFSVETIHSVKVFLTSDDLNQEQVAGNSLFQSRVFLKDESFANAEYNINFKAKGNPAVSGPVLLTSDELKMRVITASKSMYEYYKSIESSRIKGEANSSISEPVQVYSNVSNGLGVFAGYNDHTYDLK